MWRLGWVVGGGERVSDAGVGGLVGGTVAGPHRVAQCLDDEPGRNVPEQ